MKYLKQMSLLAVISMIAAMNPVLASSQEQIPPLNTEETGRAPSQTVKQKKTTEEKANKVAENVGRETGKGAAKVEKAAKKAKKAYHEAHHKEKHKS